MSDAMGDARRSPARRVTWALVAMLAAWLARPAVASAHADAPLAPHDLWAAWTWEPTTLLGLVLSAWLYGRGARALWRRAGVARSLTQWQAVGFAAALLALAVALVSPLAALAGALFSAHMAQHLLLVLVAAPLLTLGNPRPAVIWGLPASWRPVVGRWAHWPAVRRAGRCLSHPGAAWALHASALGLWHAPALYEAALAHPAIHAAEHASLLGTALLFWWMLVESGRRDSLGHGAGLLAVFTLGLIGSLFGALITLADRPWYPAYATSTPAWGLTPLADQQLAGLLMWVPAGMVYLFAAGVLFLVWLGAVERSVRRREQRAERPTGAGTSAPLPIGEERMV